MLLFQPSRHSSTVGLITIVAPGCACGLPGGGLGLVGPGWGDGAPWARPALMLAPNSSAALDAMASARSIVLTSGLVAARACERGACCLNVAARAQFPGAHGVEPSAHAHVSR